MQTTPKLGLVLPSGDGDPFDELPFVNALVTVDDRVPSRLGRFTAAAAAVSAFDFVNIPATYSDLLLVAQLRGTIVGSPGALVRCNNDATGAYIYEWGSLTAAGTMGGSYTSGATFMHCGNVVGAVGGGHASPVQFLLPNYAGGVLQKQALAWSGDLWNGVLGFVVSMYQSFNAINRLTLMPSSGNWEIGSRASLYGLA